MFLMSIVATLHHSEILIWIRLCHVRGLRKWGFFLFFSHSFLFPLCLSHLHAASFQALWCACFNLELNGICGAAVPIGGRITDPRVHCGMPPFWWVGVKIAVKQQPQQPEESNWVSNVDPKCWPCWLVVSVFHLRIYHLWVCGTVGWWLYEYLKTRTILVLYRHCISAIKVKLKNLEIIDMY